MLIVLLVISIVIANSFIIFSNEGSRFYFAKVTTTVTSAVALATGLVMIYKYKRKEEIHDSNQFYKRNDKVHFSISLFLVLWFSAQLIWSFYEQQSATPSIADAFWLIGYGLFGYFLYNLCYSFRKELEPHTFGIIVLIVTLSIMYTVVLILSASSLLSTQHVGTSILILTLTYPILDWILLVPAALIFWMRRTIISEKKGEKTYQQLDISWILLSLSIILFAIADSGFAYISALNLMMVEKEAWIWNIFYNSGYLCLAAALTGYASFLDFTKIHAAY
jgi:hypothetical protein